MVPSNNQQSIPVENEPDPPLSFPKWAATTIQTLRKSVGIGGLIALAVAISYLEPGTWLTRWADDTLESLLEEKSSERATIAFVQAFVCLVLAVMAPKAKLPSKFLGSEDRAQIAMRSCRRIRELLAIVFFLWSAYYAITGFGLLYAAQLVDRPFLITLSGLTSLIIFCLYLEMGEITIDGDGLKTRYGDVLTYRVMGVGIFLLLIAVTWYGYARNDVKMLDLMDMAVAALSGIGLCFVVGRFADKLLNPGAVTLFFLYLYAVIQLGAAVMAEKPVVHLIVTTLAMPLKILLWLVCVWAFTTGILGEYVHEIRSLIERVEKARSKGEGLSKP